MAGAFAGVLIVHRTRAAGHRGRLLLYALLAETVCVVAALVVTLVSGTPYVGGVRFALVVLLALGLGTQNAASRALAVPDLTTTVLTLTITGTAADSRPAGGAGSLAGRRTLSVAAMFLGALGGALAVLERAAETSVAARRRPPGGGDARGGAGGEGSPGLGRHRWCLGRVGRPLRGTSGGS